LWQNEYFSTPVLLNPQVGYWVEQLKDVPESVSLLPNAIADSRPAVKTHNVDSVSLQIDESVTKASKLYCKEAAVTTFMHTASALKALVYRLTGDSDVVVGITDGDRGHELAGFTVNMLPIRSKPTSDMTFADLVEELPHSLPRRIQASICAV
jgi:Condensation domain